jgi:hypothetical protein
MKGLAPSLVRHSFAIFTGLLLLSASASRSCQAADLRVGIIGLDTSHTTAFTELLNNANAKNHIPGAKVIVAYKGGSRDLPDSWDRVEEYTKALQTKYGVKIVDSIEDLCAQVDVVLLESVDGRPHLEQAKPVILAGKTLFIDKPVAGSLKDAMEIYRLAKARQVPCFTSSAYRYYDSMVALKKVDVGTIRGAISYGPCALEPHHPDFFWYGIHPVEALFTVLGPGCETVSRTTTADIDVATGVWSDGKVGSLHGLRNMATPHKVIVFGSKNVAEQSEVGDDYAPLVREIVKFFQTGVAPVSPEETLNMFAFMEAADESKRRGGAPVSLREVIEKNSPR